MATPFQNIAEKLAKFTIAPSREAIAFGKIGKGITEGISREVAPFRQQEIKEITTGEFAATPYRMNLAKVSGRDDWAKLATQWETTRNAFVNWKPVKILPVGKHKIPIVFDADFVKSMKPGESIKIGNGIFRRNSEKVGAGYVLTTPEGVTPSGSGVGHENIIKLFGTKIGEKEIELKEAKEVGPTGKSREELRREMRFQRARINRLIPGTSQLEKLVAREDILGARAGARVGGERRERLSDLYKLKFKDNQEHLKLLLNQDKGLLKQLDKLSGDVPYSTVHEFFLNHIRNVHQTMEIKPIEEGAFTDYHNALLSAFSNLNEDLVNQHLNVYRADIVKKIDDINKIPERKQGLKILENYGLLLNIAPLAGDPLEKIAGAVGFGLMKDVFSKVPTTRIRGWNTFVGGELMMPLFLKDYYQMVKPVLRKKSEAFEESLEKKGRGLFNDTMRELKKLDPKLLREAGTILPRGATPETIHKIIKTNLIKNLKIATYAPRDESAFRKPTETQRLWINLFKATYGRPPTLNDVKGIPKTTGGEILEATAAEIEKRFQE